MAPLNEQQLVQIRDERREQIMGAALKVFARRGVIGTKMSLIAAEAGISHGLLYHYFKSKEELFVTLVRSAVEGAEQAVVGRASQPGTPLVKLKRLAADILDVESAPYFQLIYHARTSDGVPEQAKELIAKYSMEAYIEHLTPLFVEGQEAGEIIDGDPAYLISSFLTVISGIMTMQGQENNEYTLPEAELLVRMISK